MGYIEVPYTNGAIPLEGTEISTTVTLYNYSSYTSAYVYGIVIDAAG